MFKCKSCGHIFEEGEQAEWEEKHGLDAPPYEHFSGCPLCHGNYGEVCYCKKCGMPFTENELTYGLCDECVEKYSDDWELCYKFSKDDEIKENVKINDFLAFMFDDDEIEEILYNHLKKTYRKEFSRSPRDYVSFDRDWFAMKLDEEFDKKKEVATK